MPPIRWTSLLCVLLVLLVATVADAAPRLHISQLDEHQTRYYRLFTNLPPDQAKPYAEHLDLVFEEFTRLLSAFETRQRYRRQSVFLVATRDQYIGLMRSFGIRAEHSGGMYFQGETHRQSGVATYVGEQSPQRVREVLRHETFHLFHDYRLDGRFPTWLNEGFAEYFSKAIVTEDGRVEVGLADPESVRNARQMARSGQFIRLEQMFEVSGKAWTRHMRRDMGSHTQNQYLQAWSLVYFLMHADNGRYRGAFERFVHNLARGRAQRQAFRDAFGTEFEHAQRAWLRFVAKMVPDNLTIARLHLQAMGDYLQQHAPTPQAAASGEHWGRLLQPEQAPLSPMLAFNQRSRSTNPAEPQRTGWRSAMNYRTSQGKWVPFEAVTPKEGRNLPPTLVAKALSPTVQLRWQRTSSGRPQYTVVFASSSNPADP